MRVIPQHRQDGDPQRALRAVRVTAPGRLHIGFLDLSGSLGRRFGSLGMTLERPVTRVLMENAAALSTSGPDAARAEKALRCAAAEFGVDESVKITVEAALPAHSGLGSGTQLALAVGVGACALSGKAIDPRDVAYALSRGARSSIGLGAFQGGGILLDGGKPVAGPRRQPPPLLSRIPIPDAWRILLIFDQERVGLSGGDETQAMDGLPPFPEALADRLCRLTIMAALPAAAEGDAIGFGRAVGEIQRRLGDHFAQFQGGRFTSPDVAEALRLIEAAGVPGVGQSSWGPTGFAVFGEAAAADDAARDLRRRFADRPNLVFDVVRGNNHGATVEVAPVPAHGATV
ncbi:beta-ribofuranosylaminobenzene 5'-phosphate synthase family protein [Hansschlegelia sp.]|uniref:beta-ribofuranosylaminobenzene 5'-phosphate synthase family protein n=1 Tax=Hansschlegelia sp. TaxID=2041892 RepID=UPI002B7E114D|nr:beta-ribofuranosylaminobenzene 5'-phosphate synthase family protein [Hansschlegelia sp.]HVI29209.1 beta-ribofuranosylaminobenzene 5'-phosphate synthase family protein [Hansschlegelia sp.]